MACQIGFAPAGKRVCKCISMEQGQKLAKFKVSKSDFIDIGEWEFPDLDKLDIEAGKKKIVLSFGEGNSLTLEGTGFKYGSGGLPIAGKLRKISMEEGGEELVTMSGLKIQLAEFLDAALGDSDTAVIDMLQDMLRQGDSFSGGNRGDDFLGFKGRDKLTGNGGSDYLDGGNGRDKVIGGQGKDALFGGVGKDRVDGGRGKDFISGDAGADTLAGGKGADTFLYVDLFHSAPGAKDRDTIRDFKPGQDVIDLSGIDIDQSTIPYEGFSFIGEARFSGEAGELRIKTNKKNSFVYGDADGDGRADLVIKLKGAVDLGADDFVL